MPIETPVQKMPKPQALSCTACGAALELHAMGWAVTVVCPYCGSTLDATDSRLRVLQAAQNIRFKPLISLGTRLTWKETQWEAIGAQQVTISVEGEQYSWVEYVCFNPWQGFLYLSEYEGHWNVIEKLHGWPEKQTEGERPTATYRGKQFKHFQTATAYTTAALGEFPWELRVGDSIVSADFIAPPFILSSEQYENEVTWSMGTYTTVDDLQRALGANRVTLPSPRGVFANQPNPRAGKIGSLLKVFGLAVAALVLMMAANIMLSSDRTVFSHKYLFARGTEDSAAFVTDAFDVAGRPSSVVIDISSPLSDDWLYLSFALINENSGEVREVSKELSFYSGVDSDGRWTEGSQKESARIASVPAGRYFLRVQPEGGDPTVKLVPYTIRVRRDVPYFPFYGIALLFLVVPVAYSLIRYLSFENKRWMESDHPPSTGSDDDDDDGDDDD